MKQLIQKVRDKIKQFAPNPEKAAEELEKSIIGGLIYNEK